MRAARVALSALVLACTAVAGWGTHAFWQERTRSPQVSAVDALVQRCSLQMLKDTCRVMSSPASTQPAGSRLLIAGVGEVDSATFAELRRYGDTMCQAIGAQCAADWSGASCRIARALYPARPE
jgi:hypothetical protein